MNMGEVEVLLKLLQEELENIKITDDEKQVVYDIIIKELVKKGILKDE